MKTLAKKNFFRTSILLTAALLSTLFLVQRVGAAHIDVDLSVHPAPEANAWVYVKWVPELDIFVALAASGTNQVMTSPDGINWTPRPAAEANQWRSVAWSPELNLLVAVANTGTNRVMTSSDGGITWDPQTAAENNQWHDIAWSPELDLFVAVAQDGTNRVMTSQDGIAWDPQTAAEANVWLSVVWAPDQGQFVAVAGSGTNRAMTSPDGITWTPQSTPADSWRSVTYSPELDLFAAVGISATATSPDGITWTPRTVEANPWESVTWSPELGMFLATAGSGPNSVMTSHDGITWTSQPVPEDNPWQGVTWSPDLGKFVAVSYGGTNRVMTGVPLPTIPKAPLNLTATTAGGDQIQLSWDAAISDNPYSPPTGYKIERSIAGGPFSVLVANTNSTSTTYLDTGLEPGTEYTYRISAINAAGTSSPSDVAAATTQAMLAPTGTDALPYIILASTLIVGGAAAVVWSARKRPGNALWP